MTFYFKLSEEIRDETNNGSGGMSVLNVSKCDTYVEISNSSSKGSRANSFSTSITRSQDQYKYISKDLNMATKMGIIIETAIGIKKERVEKINNIVEGLSKRKSKLDNDIETHKTHYTCIKNNDTGHGSDELRLKCYLSYSIANMIDERSNINKQIFNFKIEIKRLNHEIIEHEKMYRKSVYKKEKIVKYFYNRK